MGGGYLLNNANLVGGHVHLPELGGDVQHTGLRHDQKVAIRIVQTLKIIGSKYILVESWKIKEDIWILEIFEYRTFLSSQVWVPNPEHRMVKKQYHQILKAKYNHLNINC